ncbi:MAG: hypothetical protein K8S27_00690 [Candidatus Omnitrophica bacterium]|nr:hypothetical protein [Candidatus Omnitrophota bacterium]
MYEGKITRRFELLYLLAQLNETEPELRPIPIRALEDMIVLLKCLNNKLHDFSILLIDDDWYSPEILDDIEDLYNFGYISIQHSFIKNNANTENNYSILMEANKDVIIKNLSDKVIIAENQKIISKLSRLVIDDELHKFVVYLLEKNNGDVNYWTNILTDEESYPDISKDYAPFIKTLQEKSDESNTPFIATL